MLTDMKVIVIGAGVAGLAVARALALRGARVRVIEQAGTIAEVGAGLQIAPNGARVIAALGLGESLGRLGQRLQSVQLLNGETGEQVARLPMDRPGWTGGFHALHRADLIALLLDGARAAGAEVATGLKVTGVTPGSPARVSFAGGATADADLVVGADGLHSVARAALNGRVVPFFTHQVAWRATLHAEGPIAAAAQVWMGAGRHLVTYPLRGGTLRNIVAVEERRTWAEESWSLTDDGLALRVAFEDFVPAVRGWLDLIDRPNLWGLFRHPVAAVWTATGVALAGDAAHPTLPFLAQGANMALEDAWVLAETLAAAPDPGAGLAAYAAARAPRAARIVVAADANARNYHLSGLRRTVGHAALSLVGRLAPGVLAGRFDWLYGHDVTKDRPVPA